MISAMSDWFRTYGFAQVHGDLLIGAYPLDGDDIPMLAAMSVRQVLNLVEDAEARAGPRAAVEEALREARIDERRLQLTDFGRLPADELEEAVRLVVTWLKAGIPSYVHCRAGWQALRRRGRRRRRRVRGHRHRRGRRPRPGAQALRRPGCRTRGMTSATGGTLEPTASFA